MLKKLQLVYEKSFQSLKGSEEDGRVGWVDVEKETKVIGCLLNT